MSVAKEPPTYYEVLDIDANATFQEIEDAHARLTALLEPDSLAVYSMLDEQDLATKRDQVDDAYRILSDPERRAAYDGYLNKHAREGASFSSVIESGSDGPGWMINVVPEPQPREPAVQLAVTAAPRPRARSSLRVSTSRPRRLYPADDLPDLDSEAATGGLLRRLRRSAGASLDDVAEITKISKRYLRALEDDDFATLPAPVYVHGFAREYAKILGLDFERFAKGYVLALRQSRGEGS